MENYNKEILKALRVIVFGLGMIIGFLFCNIVRADECKNDPNLKSIEKTYKDIRAIYAHPDSVYLRLHDDDRKEVRKHLKEKPELKIYLE